MGTGNAKKPGRLYPTTRSEWFKVSVEDSVMALMTGDSPTQIFTTEMIVRGEKDKFEKTIGRLCELGCRKNVLFECLSRLKSPLEPKRLKNLPSAASLGKLARRMEKIAQDIKRIEGTGVLDPLDEEELCGNFDDIVSGANARWIRELPNSLERRAGMYRRCSERLSTERLRRDLLSRVNRLCLAVYVRLATNPDHSPEPIGRYSLVATLMKCVGEPADRSQLRRDLRHFESMHFQTRYSLENRLRASHNGTHPCVANQSLPASQQDQSKV